MQFRVIGEDLGTVSEETRRGLDEYGVLSYKVLYFMRGGEGTFLPAEAYGAEAVATVTTHDLPTIAGFWGSRDIEARWQAGLLSPDDHKKQLDDREVDKQRLLELLHDQKLVKSSFPSTASRIPSMT